MKILHLTVKKKWFDMIASGQKKEEYRELKDYWGVRLCVKIKVPWGGYLSKWFQLREGNIECLNDPFIPNFEKYDAIQLKNGYTKDAPALLLECKGIDIGPAKPEWSDNWQGSVFRIKLGKILTQTTTV